MSDNTITHFVVLFTAQKTRKRKVWQDGTMKYYSFNRKLVLTDEKGYNIDRKFYKGGVPIVGDELEFDGHIVTIESFEHTEHVQNNTAPLPPATLPRQNNVPAADPLPPSPPPPPHRALPQRMRQTIPPRSAREPIYQSSRESAPQYNRNPQYQQPMPQYQQPVPPYQQTMPTQEMSEPQAQASREETPLFTRAPPPTQLSNFAPPPAMPNPRKRIIQMDNENEGSEEEDKMDVDSDTPLTTIGATADSDRPLSAVAPAAAAVSSSTTPRPAVQQQQPLTPPTPQPLAQFPQPVKRVRVGLSKRTASTLHSNSPIATAARTINTTESVGSAYVNPRSTTPSGVSDISNMDSRGESSFTPASRVNVNPEASRDPTSKPFKSPVGEGNSIASQVLQFPNSKKCMSVLQTKKFPKRTKVVPTKFANTGLYRDTFIKVIMEHLDITMVQYGMFYHTMAEKYGKNKQGQDLERTMRAKGVGIYCLTELKGDARSASRLRLMMKQNREHYSKYQKDDIWVISKVSTFESSQTFLARSTYFGPFSDGAVELDCISARDVRVASKVLQASQFVYALRTFSASTEFMMLDTLNEKLDQLPLLPYILQDPVSHMKKRKNQVVSPQPLPIMEHIKITREDNVDVEAKLEEVIKMYKLNVDQETVLRQVAKSVIAAPNWNQDPAHPIVLVHGVYGSGKSFLAAVIIIFIQDIVDMVNDKREPEDQISYNILVSSMTNVAVDRILQTLLKLGYDHFTRIGSMKKIAKSLLPYTSKARLTSNEELKELKQMLDDPQNTEEDIDNISTAIQHFRKSEGTLQIQNTAVVGTTFMSSAFEVFNDIKFPLVLVDESSQLMEPLTMVPLARFSCHRLVMIGDPLQLPPTITTPVAEDKVGKGLEKTIFDRMIEMGHESLMLRTQYRCHPRISDISNKLFYDRRLLNGVTNEDRKPLMDGLPTLLFVDVGGTEQKAKNNSFWNDTELAISAHLIQNLISFDVSPNDLGVISLYKEQADRLSGFTSSGSTDSTTSKNVQISTVDAFQGGEKEVIILSTVRTTESQFMDNYARINVAITRAKRHLIILGNRNLLSMNALWSKILWDCQENCMNGSSLARLLAEINTRRISNDDD